MTLGMLQQQGGLSTMRAKAGCVPIFLLLSVLGAAAGRTPEKPDAKPLARPEAVYVSDFLLEVRGDRTVETGAPPLRGKVKEAVNRLGPDREGRPEEEAARIIETLAQSIVSRLNDKGINAARFSAKSDLSRRAWLIEGQFSEYDEGSRLKRTIIGFGSGSPSLQVEIVIGEIVDGVVSPFYGSTVEGMKNRMPGALVTRNVYVAGAKFILTKRAPERKVKKLGSDIADRVYEIMREHGLTAGESVRR